MLLRERPKLRPCLRCGRMRMSTRANRLHERDCDRTAVAFSPAEHRRINAYLAAHTPKVKATPGPKPKDPDALQAARDRMVHARAHRRSGPLKPFPTEAEVARMTPPQKASLRQRYKVNGLALPAYLRPLTPYEAGCLGGVVKTAIAAAKT